MMERGLLSEGVFHKYYWGSLMNLKIGFDIEEAKKFYTKYWIKGSSPDHLLSRARSATVQRGNFYSAEVDERMKGKLWSDYHGFVAGKLEDYRHGGVEESWHIANINELISDLSSRHSSALMEGVVRYGSAQKLFNLTLKCFWVIGEISEPPHIPVDSYIANNVGIKKYAWTKNDSYKEYSLLIKRCKEVCSVFGLSIGQWELLYWNMATLPSKI